MHFSVASGIKMFNPCGFGAALNGFVSKCLATFKMGGFPLRQFKNPKRVLPPKEKQKSEDNKEKKAHLKRYADHYGQDGYVVWNKPSWVCPFLGVPRNGGVPQWFSFKTTPQNGYPRKGHTHTRTCFANVSSLFRKF